jgi:hypothetical protein
MGTLIRIHRPNRVLVSGVFTGLALLGIAASLSHSQAMVIGLEDPELITYWEQIGLKHAIKVSPFYDLPTDRCIAALVDG